MMIEWAGMYSVSQLKLSQNSSALNSGLGGCACVRACVRACVF